MSKIYALLFLIVAQISLATSEIEISFNGTTYSDKDTISVGNVNISSNQDFTLTLKSTDTDTLIINSISQNSGTDFIISQALKDKLAKDSSTTASFSFTPTCDGIDKFTTVSINSNSSTQPIFTLVLKGKSVDTELPQITCPSTIEKCNAQVINYATPTFSDNCSISGTPNLNSGIASGNTFPVGTSTQVFQITDDAGNSNQCSFDVIIHETPDQAVINQSSITICDSTTSLTGNTPSVGTGYWKRLTNSGEITDSLAASTTLTKIPYGISKYSWNIKNGNCTTTSDTITIARDIETTQANAGQDQSLCNSNSTTLAGNGTGTWTKTQGGATIDSPNNAITQVTFISPGTNQFVWTINSTNSCPNSSDTIDVINSQKPQSGAISPNDNVCGTRDTVSALKPLVGTGQWSVISGSGTLQTPSDTFSIVENLSIGENKFLWKVSNGSCPAQQDTLTITRNEDVTAKAGGAQTVCTDSVQLNAEIPSIGSGRWVISSPLTVKDENDPKTIANNLKNGLNVFVWLVTNGACVDNDIVFVSYNDDISPSNAGTDQKICDATQTQLNAQTAGDAAGSWTIVQGSATLDNPSSENTIIRDINDPLIKAVWEISAFGCTSSYDTVSILRDTIDPEIVCPNDTTIFSVGNQCNVIFNFTEPVGTDDCPNPITTLESGLGTGASYSLGTHSNTYKVTDKAFGRSSQCSFNVTVKDTVKPIIACTDTIELNNDSTVCGAIHTFSLPTASDNCNPPTGGLVVTQIEGITSGNEFPVGRTTLVFSTKDSSDNVNTCSTQVIVKDVQKPTITCANDTTVYTGINDCEATVTYNAPIAKDNCSNFTVSPIFPNTNSGDAFPLGTTTVGYRVTDNSTGKGASCTFNITVLDTIKPSINCPKDTTLFALPDMCGNNFSFNTPIASDNCIIKSTTQTAGPSSGSLFSLGKTTITYITTDSSNNTNTCSYEVTVADTTSPEITCPNNITKSSDANVCGANVTYLIPNVKDNCNKTTVTQTDITGLMSGSIFPVGTTTLTYAVTDTANNSSSCSFDITIIDDQTPTVTCPNSDTIQTDVGQCTGKYVFDSFVEGTNIFDNCSGVVATQTDNTGLTSGSDFPIGTTTLTFEIKDQSNNKASCSFDVVVQDKELPIITCPKDTTLGTSAGICATNYNYDLPTISDNCSSPTISFVSGVQQGGSFNSGSTTVVYKVTDKSGNEAQCSFDVTVNDVISPTIACAQLDETIFVNNNCSAPYSYSIKTDDNCDTLPIVIRHKGFDSGSILQLGKYDYWFTAKDKAGNVSDTCKYVVTVEDNTKPVLNCPASITLCAEQTYTFPDATVSDNCTNSSNLTVTQSSGKPSGSTFTIGDNQVVFASTDEAGNRGTCAFSVIVVDTTLVPKISGGDTIEVCDTIIPLFILNNDRGIDHKWEILSGQGKLSDTIGNTTTVDSISYSSNVQVLLTSEFGSCTTKRDTSLILFKDSPSASNIKSSYLLCDVNTLTIDATVLNTETMKWKQLSGTPITFDNDSINKTTITGFSNNDETYSFSFTASANQCKDSVINFSVTGSTSPTISVSEDTAVYIGETVPLEAIVDQKLVDISWSANNLFISSKDIIDVSPNKTTTYYATATNSKGCFAEDSVKVTYKDGVVIYTGITPNDDKVNDTWVIRGIKNYPDADVQVFTQWGQKVYNSTGYDEPWDATNNGKPVPFGVYYYIIDLNDGNAKKTGTITVLK